MNFSVSKRFESITHAFRGAVTLVATQHNAWVHLFATVAVVAVGFYFRVSSIEWIALIFAIALVWIAEALNTGIEFLADEVSQERRERIKKAKDVAAFGVLAASAAAATIGFIIFIPYLGRFG